MKFKFTILKNGIQVSTDTIEQNYSKYIQSSNPVRAFIEVALEKTSYRVATPPLS